MFDGTTRRIQPYRRAGQKNKLEIAYEEHLEVLRRAGDIEWYEFEAMKFEIGKRCWYTPDFAVLAKATGGGGAFAFECHEVKGYWRDDARVKIKACAAKFWWIRWVAVF